MAYHIVREIRRFHPIAIANAVSWLRHTHPVPAHTQLGHLPRPVLERILNQLVRNKRRYAI